MQSVQVDCMQYVGVGDADYVEPAKQFYLAACIGNRDMQFAGGGRRYFCRTWVDMTAFWLFQPASNNRMAMVCFCGSAASLV